MNYQHNPQTRDNQSSQTSSNAQIDPGLLKGLEWRSAGPYRGGRVIAVAGDPRDKQRFYFGSTGGEIGRAHV